MADTTEHGKATSPTDIALGQAKAASAGVRRAPWWGTPLVALVIFGALAPMGGVLGLGALTTLTTVLYYTVIAQGWNRLGGFGGYRTFGAAVCAGNGAYTAAWLNSEYDWNLWQTLIPAAIAAAFVSLIVGFATLRLRSHY